MEKHAHLVLIIEDDEDIRGLLAKSFQAAGFTVETAATGLQGLELFQKSSVDTPIDLVVLDLVIPTKGGIETLLEMRDLEHRIGRHTKIIVITGKVPVDTQVFRNLVSQFKVDAVVEKPFEIQSIVKKADQLIHTK